jgi:DHA1 family tetracycline resistance protein-like MFS transporter
MSRAADDDAQGELQGVISSTAALAVIVSPMLMTFVFSTFAATLPGAPFLVAAGLTATCLAIFMIVPGKAAT